MLETPPRPPEVVKNKTFAGTSLCPVREVTVAIAQDWRAGTDQRALGSGLLGFGVSG